MHSHSTFTWVWVAGKLTNYSIVRWTVICRGAVLHGLGLQKVPCRNTVEVESRVARASYSMCFEEEWMVNKHAKMDKKYLPTYGCHMAVDQTRWFLKLVGCNKRPSFTAPGTERGTKPHISANQMTRGIGPGHLHEAMCHREIQADVLEYSKVH